MHCLLTFDAGKTPNLGGTYVKPNESHEAEAVTVIKLNEKVLIGYKGSLGF